MRQHHEIKLDVDTRQQITRFVGIKLKVDYISIRVCQTQSALLIILILLLQVRRDHVNDSDLTLWSLAHSPYHLIISFFFASFLFCMHIAIILFIPFPYFTYGPWPGSLRDT